MKSLFCAAFLLLPSVAWAEPIRFESADAFWRPADDTLRINFALSEPIDIYIDYMRIWIDQHRVGEFRRVAIDFATFDERDGTIEATYFRRLHPPAPSDRLDEESFRLPIAFDYQSVSLAIPRTDANLYMDDWYTRIQVILDDGQEISWDRLAHAPEPSTVALAGIGVAVFVAHRLLRLPCSRKRRRERHVVRER
jgi:hypothetical protein